MSSTVALIADLLEGQDGDVLRRGVAALLVRDGQWAVSVPHAGAIHLFRGVLGALLLPAARRHDARLRHDCAAAVAQEGAELCRNRQQTTQCRPQTHEKKGLCFTSDTFC